MPPQATYQREAANRAARERDESRMRQREMEVELERERLMTKHGERGTALTRPAAHPPRTLEFHYYDPAAQPCTAPFL